MITSRLRAPVAALLISLGLAPMMAHAEMDSVVREALALAESGQARRAYELLEPLEVQRAGDPDFDTVFGIAANQAGEHARAVMALERATQVQPGNARARAELGRAMFAVGDSKSARTLLEQAKSQGAPAEAALTIDQFLRAIDVAESLMQSTWRGYVEATVGHDSNLSSGPANANVAVPALGGPVTLAANAVKQGSGFGQVTAGVSGRYVIDSRWSAIGSASYNYRSNFSASTFNNSQFNLEAGAAYRLDRQEYSLVAVHEDYRVDGSINRTQTGLVGEWVYRMDNQREAGAYVQYSNLRYPSLPVRDARRVVGGLPTRSNSVTVGWPGAVPMLAAKTRKPPTSRIWGIPCWACALAPRKPSIPAWRLSARSTTSAATTVDRILSFSSSARTGRPA
jgi:tetratricopeptide (TPR) repeat protein